MEEITTEQILQRAEQIAEKTCKHLEDFILVLEGIQRGGLPILAPQIADLQDSVEDLRWLVRNL